MWPRLLDMDLDQCKLLLRRLELEAYSSVVSAFRAQGDLNAEKKQLLRNVASTLGISTERHKAEVRRAVNDEKLTTVAERIGGDNSSIEWSVEGRRLVPLMPRHIPQTVFTVTANQVANMAHAHNATLPDPEQTARKEGYSSLGDGSRPATSGPNHIVLPPGTVLPKTTPDLQSLEEQAKSRSAAAASSASPFTSNPASFLSALTSSVRHTSSHSTAGSGSGSGSKVTVRSSSSTASTGSTITGGASSSAMKITFSKMSTGTTLTTTQAGQKVIIVSSANSTSQSQTLSSDAILHRSHSLPPSSKVSMATASESQAISSSHPVSLEEAMPAISTSGQPAVKHHRSKSGSKQKAPKPATVVSRTEGSALSTSTSGTGTGGSGVVPTVIGASGKRTSQSSQRPEPGMKLITQTVTSSGGRMPSKAYQVSSTTTSSPTVRTTTIALPASKTSVSAGSSSPIMGVRNLVSTTGPRIVTVPSPITGRSPPTMSNVITLSPMALQKSGAKSTTTTVVVTKPGTVPGKTNVIVVQKSQVKSKTISSSRSTAPGIMTITTSILTRPKIAMTMTSGNPGVVPLPSTSLGSPSPSIRFPSPSVSSQKMVRGPSPVGAGTAVGGTLSRGRSPTSPLSVGQVIGSKGQVMMRPKSPIAQTIATLSAPRSPLPTNPEMQAKIKGHRRSSSKSPPGQSSQKLVESLAGGVVRSAIGGPEAAKMAGRESSLIFQTGSKPNTEWIEYDGSPPASQSASSAIKALLEFKSQPPPAPASVKQVSIPGVIPGMMPSAVRHLSTVATTTTTSTAAGGQPKEPTKNPSIVTVEVQGGSAERLEFSTDQLSSVVDQFEQFLESEEKEEKKEGKDSDSELRRRLMAPSIASTSKEKAVTVSKVSSPPFKLEGAKEVKGGVADPKVEHTGVDPFEFVEEGVSTKEPTPVRKATHKQEPPRSAATEAKEPSEQVSTEGAKAEVQQAPAVSLVTQGPGAGPLASVVMESSSSFDITQMNLEDLSCQRMQEEEEEEEEGEAEEEGEEKREDDPGSSGEMLSFQEASSGGSGSEGVVGADGTVRVSRRKRKAPTPIDEETGPSSMPSWARAAWNLLQRVMRFRGANRPKGGINAASWFTRPVDPLEAPGYHKLIKKPMDFGTIKRNLEAGTYLDFGEFHQDMMLVRSNCLQYNPAGHAARRDCEEVFQFYSSEYSKTLDRWQKQMLVVPKSPKRLRTEPPPQP